MRVERKWVSASNSCCNRVLLKSCSIEFMLQESHDSKGGRKLSGFIPIPFYFSETNKSPVIPSLWKKLRGVLRHSLIRNYILTKNIPVRQGAWELDC